MRIGIVISIAGVLVALVIGAWQIWLARKQHKSSASLNVHAPVTSSHQVGGQTAHSITNVERQVILTKHYSEERLSIDAFAIDPYRCSYKEHKLDPTRPFWPKEADPITVCYEADGKMRAYGREFNSWNEANNYGKALRQKYNHYSFCEGAPHTMFLERLDEPLRENPPNYPVFYVAISNHTNEHVVLSEIAAKVFQVDPLAAIGESHALVPLATYEIDFPPREGVYRKQAIPNLKIESGDAGAFHVLLKPSVRMMGSYHWFMTVDFRIGGELLSSDMFAVIM